MTIPKSVKVGGKTYKVEITDRLDFGAANCAGEIIYDKLIIRILPNPEQEMHGVLLHEIVHAILQNLGYRDHDEQKVDELANALHALIVDNPGIFERKKT